MSYEQAVVRLEEANANLVEEVTRFRDAAAGLNNIYTTTAEGIAGVADGKYFVVPGNGTFLKLYRRNGAAANEIAEFPSRAAMDAAVNAAADNAEARATVEANRAFTEANRAEVYADNKGFVTREQFRRSASLDLDFARGKYLVDGGELTETTNASEVLTVERATPKWVFGPNGKLREVPPNTVARSWNPKTGECEGVLIEESRTNLLTYSEQFDNAAWDSSASISADAVAAPDGSTLADKIVESATDGTHAIAQYKSSLLMSTPYTFSVYIKPAGRNFARIAFHETADPYTYAFCVFDLVNETFTLAANGDNAISATIVDAGNGWKTCTFTASFAVSGAHVFYICPDISSTGTGNNRGRSSYTGDGTSGIYVWGAQLEEGSTASSYIPTNGAPVTRAADNVSRTLGAEFNENEGTLFAEAEVLASYPDTVFIAVLGPTDFNRVAVVYSGGKLVVQVRGASGITDFAKAISTRSVVRVAVSYNNTTGSCVLAIGGSSATASNTFISSGSSLIVGRQYGASYLLDIPIVDIAYYPRAMTAAELEALTAP